MPETYGAAYGSHLTANFIEWLMGEHDEACDCPACLFAEQDALREQRWDEARELEMED